MTSDSDKRTLTARDPRDPAISCPKDQEGRPQLSGHLNSSDTGHCTVSLAPRLIWNHRPPQTCGGSF